MFIWTQFVHVGVSAAMLTTSAVVVEPSGEGAAGEAAREAGAAAVARDAGEAVGVGGVVGGRITTAEELLTRLEAADVGLRSLRAEIQYVRVFGVMGDRQVREGTLQFLDERPAAAAGGVGGRREGDDPAIERGGAGVDGAGVDGAGGDGAGGEGELVSRVKVLPPGRRFGVRFTRVQIGSRIERTDETYVFDGTNLVHAEPERQQVTVYSTGGGGGGGAAEGRDPLRLGEGPLPLPIAQKREDILRRFDVELLAAEAGIDEEDEKQTALLREFVAGCYQVRLVPKAEFAKSLDATEIRLWYRETALTAGDGAKGDGTKKAGAGDGAEMRLLPRMARTVNKAGDVSLVRLINVVPNGAVDEKALRFDEVPDGWEVIVRELAGPSDR